MIRKEDVIAIAIHAYKSGLEDGKSGAVDPDGYEGGIEDMVLEALADCENYNENLN